MKFKKKKKVLYPDRERERERESEKRLFVVHPTMARATRSSARAASSAATEKLTKAASTKKPGKPSALSISNTISPSLLPWITS